MAEMASSRGSTPLIAKKQVCMIVLMRLPIPVLPRDRISVNHVKFQFLIQDLLLHLAGQVLPDLIGGKGRVQQERRARFGRAEHVHAFQERKLVAGNEVRPGNQISGFNRVRSEAQSGRR